MLPRATSDLERLPKIKTINYTRGAQSSWTQEHIWRTKRLSRTPHTHKKKLGVGLALVRLCVWIGANPHPPQNTLTKHLHTETNQRQRAGNTHVTSSPNNKKRKSCSPTFFLMVRATKLCWARIGLCMCEDAMLPAYRASFCGLQNCATQ